MHFLDEIMERVQAANHPPQDVSVLSFVCSRCGQEHSGLMDLGIDAPAAYLASSEEEREKDFIKNDDLCDWNGEHFFVRCVLPIPIHGTEEYFGYGAWSSLSQKNFELYRKHWDQPVADGLGPWFGWLSNSLKGYTETLNLQCQVHPLDGGNRPLIELEPTDHPLAIEQCNGISPERLFEIYAANGHGPSLP